MRYPLHIPTVIAVALIVVGIWLASGLEVGGTVAIGFACFVLGVVIAANLIVTILDVK